MAGPVADERDETATCTAAPPAPHRELLPADVVWLQRVGGNRAVGRLLQRIKKEEVLAALTTEEAVDFRGWIEGQDADYDSPVDVERILVRRSLEDVRQMIRMYRLSGSYTPTGQPYHAFGGARVNIDLLTDEPLVKATETALGKAEGKEVLSAKVTAVLRHLHAELGNAKEERDNLMSGRVNSAMPLGRLLQAQALMCREKALFAHLLLATLGVPSLVRSGKRPDGGRHAWLVIGEKWEMDPIQGNVNVELSRTKRYTADQKDEAVLNPNQPLAPEALDALMGDVCEEFMRPDESSEEPSTDDSSQEPSTDESSEEEGSLASQLGFDLTGL